MGHEIMISFSFPLIITIFIGLYIILGTTSWWYWNLVLEQPWGRVRMVIKWGNELVFVSSCLLHSFVPLPQPTIHRKPGTPDSNEKSPPFPRNQIFSEETNIYISFLYIYKPYIYAGFHLGRAWHGNILHLVIQYVFDCAGVLERFEDELNTLPFLF